MRPSDPRLFPTMEFLRRRFRLHSRLAVNVLSELFATFLFLLIGTGLVAQFILTAGKINSYMQLSFAWGMMITLIVYGTYHTSGGHMNPAVSFAFFCLGKLPFGHFLLYWLVQTIGAFFGAALSYHIYRDVLNKFDGGIRAINGVNGTAIVFSSFPEPHIGHYTAFIDEVVGAALLVLFICALVDPRNHVPKCVQPIGFGLDLFVVVSSYGMNVGSPINPARDLGPRLFLLFAGYGWEVISWHSYYCWIPVVAPFIGALLGTLSYQFFIGIHLPDEVPLEANSQNSLSTEVGEGGKLP